MKTIDIVEATAALADYARANRRHTLVVTRRGRPIAESRRVNPPGTGLTTAQVRRALAPRRSRRVRP